MDKAKLAEIIRKHGMWLRGEADGKRADLRGAVLSGADLRGADLRDADLRGAVLSGADLSGADLRDAVLSGADLSGADLRGADLSGADLRGAVLSGADLRGADLRDAVLRGAVLRGAVLRGVKYNETTAFFAMACPEKGAFTGFKKAGGFIVELLIPDDAKRSSATTRKCRCSKAKVVSITNIDGSAVDCEGVSSDRDVNFVYRVGETVEVPDFDENRWNECSTGIHFFITRDEAVRYV